MSFALGPKAGTRVGAAVAALQTLPSADSIQEPQILLWGASTFLLQYCMCDHDEAVPLSLTLRFLEKWPTQLHGERLFPARLRRAPPLKEFLRPQDGLEDKWSYNAAR